MIDAKKLMRNYKYLKAAIENLTEEGIACDTEKAACARLDAAFSAIDKRERELLISHYVEGLSWAEIATKHGITEKWASKIGNAAIKQITNLIEPAKYTGNQTE